MSDFVILSSSIYILYIYIYIYIYKCRKHPGVVLHGVLVVCEGGVFSAWYVALFWFAHAQNTRFFGVFFA